MLVLRAMGKRISTKNKKRNRDFATAQKNKDPLKSHKIAVQRSRKALIRKAHPAI
jgi:hypothetical protein